MSTLSKSFVERIEKGLQNKKLAEILGEKCFQYETILKAIVGVNDMDFLGKLIAALILGLDATSAKEVFALFYDPKVIETILANTFEIKEE